MNKFNKYLVVILVGFLGACASAEFPEIEDNNPSIKQTQDGKKIKYVPRAGSSLKADVENVAYEDSDDVDTTLEVKELVSNDTAKEDTINIDKAEAEVNSAKVIDVIKVDLDEDKKVSSEDKPIVLAVNKESPELEAGLIEEEVVIDSTPSVTYRLDTFYFDNGGAYLDSKYNKQIRNIANIVNKNDAIVKVLGFASSRTSDTDEVSHKIANFKVSLERAQNVANAIKRAGVSEDSIEIEALSDSVPAYVEVMPEGERLNRRAEVYISY